MVTNISYIFVPSNNNNINFKNKKMRKLKVNSKLAVRKVSRLDNIDKGGLLIGALFIIPSCLALIIDVVSNGSRML